MLQDRGTIKWTSLMLPEHVKLLKEIWQEDKQVIKPILDPQEIERLNNQLIAAYEHQYMVTLSVYKDGMVTDYSSTIYKLDKNTNRVILRGKDNVKIPIFFQNIISLIIN